MLVVDDFGIKYVGHEHNKNLFQVLTKTYKIEEDQQGELYCSINLKRDYDHRALDTSMPGYILRQLQKYQNLVPFKAIILSLSTKTLEVW